MKLKENIDSNPEPQLYVVSKKYGVTESYTKENFLEKSEKITGVYKMEIPKDILDFCKEIRELGGTALVVGGSVRDMVINHEFPDKNLKSKDLDFEVYGLSKETLRLVLIKNFGEDKIDDFGKSYEITNVVSKSLEKPFDIGIPRQDSKSGDKHKDFKVKVDPSKSIKEAAFRRDLTMNSLTYDPLTETLYDPYKGIEDIKNRTIKAIDEKTFKEDPLRVMRVMQFMARFEFLPTDNTFKICRQMVSERKLDTLPINRMTEEFRKLLVKGKRPSIGLEFARETGIVERYWPELNALIGVQQPEKYHPEGDVWTHTLQVVDAAVLIHEREKSEGKLFSEETITQLQNAAKSATEFQGQKILAKNFQDYIFENVDRGSNIVFNITNRARKARLSVYEATKNTMVKSGKYTEQPKFIEKKAIEKGSKTEVGLLIQYFRKELDNQINAGLIQKNDISQIENKVKDEVSVLVEKKINSLLKEQIDASKLVLVLACLCHDMGKANTTEFIDGKWRAWEHEEEGVVVTEKFLSRLSPDKIPPKQTKMVLPLVAEHLKPITLHKEFLKGNDMNSAIRRLSVRLFKGYKNYPNGGNTNIETLALVAEADQRGRNGNSTLPLKESEINLDWKAWILEKANELDVKEKPKIETISGIELMNLLETKPGPWIGAVLKALEKDWAEGLLSSNDVTRQRAVEHYLSMSKHVDSRLEELGEINNRSSGNNLWNDISKMEDPRILEALETTE